MGVCDSSPGVQVENGTAYQSLPVIDPDPSSLYTIRGSGSAIQLETSPPYKKIGTTAGRIIKLLQQQALTRE